MGREPLSNGLSGLSRDGAILAEVLKQLAAIQEALTHVAQKDDLKEFVRQDQFASQQSSIGGRFDDHAQRLTRIETNFENLRDRFHQAEVNEANRFAGIQVAGAQQLGQAQQYGQTQLQAVQTGVTTTQTKILYGLVVVFGGALFTLLSGLIQHAIFH